MKYYLRKNVKTKENKWRYIYLKDVVINEIPENVKEDKRIKKFIMTWGNGTIEFIRSGTGRKVEKRVKIKKLNFRAIADENGQPIRPSSPSQRRTSSRLATKQKRHRPRSRQTAPVPLSSQKKAKPPHREITPRLPQPKRSPRSAPNQRTAPTPQPIKSTQPPMQPSIPTTPEPLPQPLPMPPQVYISPKQPTPKPSRHVSPPNPPSNLSKNETDPEPLRKRLVKIKCPNCNSTLKRDQDYTRYYCPGCKNEYLIFYVCPSCNEELEPGTTECPNCDKLFHKEDVVRMVAICPIHKTPMEYSVEDSYYCLPCMPEPDEDDDDFEECPECGAEVTDEDTECPECSCDLLLEDD